MLFRRAVPFLFLFCSAILSACHHKPSEDFSGELVGDWIPIGEKDGRIYSAEDFPEQAKDSCAFCTTHFRRDSTFTSELGDHAAVGDFILSKDKRTLKEISTNGDATVFEILLLGKNYLVLHRADKDGGHSYLYKRKG